MVRFTACDLFCASLLVIASSPRAAQAQSNPEEVVFPNKALRLHGLVWKPSGSGPFPAILWNHGSERMPGAQPKLAEFYLQHGFVLFLPHRRGQGLSPGNYIQDLIQNAPPFGRAQLMIELQEEEVSDVVAAVQFLRSQPFVDANRIAISGCSYGGIQTLLAGERDLGVKALVPFAPGAMSWDRNQLLPSRLKMAVDRATAPVFLIQAENDYSIEPIRTLSKEAEKKHKNFRSKLYPAFGSTHHDGHWRFCSTATDVWGNDVLAFLEQQMNPTK